MHMLTGLKGGIYSKIVVCCLCECLGIPRTFSLSSFQSSMLSLASGIAEISWEGGGMHAQGAGRMPSWPTTIFLLAFDLKS